MWEALLIRTSLESGPKRQVAEGWLGGWVPKILFLRFLWSSFQRYEEFNSALQIFTPVLKSQMEDTFIIEYNIMPSRQSYSE